MSEVEVLQDNVALKDGFDVAVGNPPFESKLSADGKKVNQAALRQDSKRGDLPDNQSAYLFLDQAFNVLRPDGRVCLIQPSGLLYNRNTQNFRSVLFRKHKVDAILDFVSIRKLFEAADPKIIAVLAQRIEPSKDHRITHLTFRRTVSVKERICFELDHYDKHSVSQEKVEAHPYVWRCNLLGGGRLFEISQRLQGMEKLIEHIKNQKDWDYGDGFTVGIANKPVSFLTGNDFLPSRAFNDTGINEKRIRPLTQTGFERPRNEAIFTPPLILIKKVDSLPIVFWDKRYLFHIAIKMTVRYNLAMEVNYGKSSKFQRRGNSESPSTQRAGYNGYGATQGIVSIING